MPISGCHDLPLATFNLPSRNNLQNKPNSAATMSLPCSRFATAQPQRRWDAPPGKQHRHSGIFRVADLGPGTMPRGKYPESPAPAGSHALISRTPPPGGMLHANLGLPRPPPRNFQPPLPQQPPKQTQQRRHNVPPVQSLRDSAAATPVGCAAWRRRFRIFSFRYREMMSGMTMIFLTVMFFPPGILSQAQLSPCRMSGTTVGRILSHSLQQPAHPPTPENPPPSSFRNLPRQRAGTPPAPQKTPLVQTSAPKPQYPALSGQNPLPLRRAGEKNIFAQFHPFHPFWRYNMLEPPSKLAGANQKRETRI